jgi:hypothetical protein
VAFASTKLLNSSSSGSSESGTTLRSGTVVEAPLFGTNRAAARLFGGALEVSREDFLVVSVEGAAGGAGGA